MNELVDIEVVRAEALRKLGRNVVNFSKIETALKCLLSVNQLEEIEEAIPNQLYKNQTRLRKQTLGKLVQEFNKNILSDAGSSELTTDSSEKGISFSFKVICSNLDFSKARKRALLEVVTERNKLIHQDLAFLDTTCIEDYQKLINLLDEQNPRLLAHLEELGWIMKSLKESMKASEELSKSPDFLQFIQSDQANA
jgi:hypothetical protein